MSQKKNNRADKKKKKSDPEKNKLDKQLKQTFPASDPPKHTRSGHKRTEDYGEQES